MSSSSSGSFEFKTANAARIFDHLVRAFELDYMTKRFARDDSGWRTLGDIAKDMRISTSIVYSKSKNKLSPPIEELLHRGLVERRFFQNERGRGGEVMRFRIAYDNELVRKSVDEMIRRGDSSHKLATSSSVVEATSLVTSKVVLAPEERRRRIAVLPFVNYSPDLADEYFADGLTEELILTFSKIVGMSVISRTSVMRYKETKKSLSEIAGELNVGAVLEGSVRKIGNDLRISAELIGVEKDELLWSETYDRKFKNIFTLQREIALKVANSLKISILAKERKGIGREFTKNMDAYILYLKGRSYKFRDTLDSFNHFVGYCKAAIEKDPKFAQAYAEVAIGYIDAGSHELIPASDAFPLAESFAEKAVQLDSSIGVSHGALAIVNWIYKWDFREAESEFRKALELEPGLVDGHLQLSSFLASLRRFDEAIFESRKALELDPLSAMTCYYVGNVLYICHRYDQAIEMLKNAIELDPNAANAYDNLGCCYIKKEMPERAIVEIKNALEHGAGGFLQKGTLGYATARAGRETEARAIMDELLSLEKRGDRTETALAIVCIGLRDYNKAVLWLEAAYGHRLGYLASINCDPLFEDLRENPRFQSLLKKIGF